MSIHPLLSVQIGQKQIPNHCHSPAEAPCHKPEKPSPGEVCLSSGAAASIPGCCSPLCLPLHRTRCGRGLLLHRHHSALLPLLKQNVCAPLHFTIQGAAKRWLEGEGKAVPLPPHLQQQHHTFSTPWQHMSSASSPTTALRR